MNRISVAVLKAKLSHYLQMVEEGEEVIVTSHKRPVARILPFADPHLQIQPPTRPVSDLRRLRGIRRKLRISAVSSLLEDRQKR